MEVKETHCLYTHIKKYLLGTSVGVSVAPGVANIPIVGWVAADWVTMFIGNQGAEMGGGTAEGLSKNY